MKFTPLPTESANANSIVEKAFAKAKVVRMIPDVRGHLREISESQWKSRKRVKVWEIVGTWDRVRYTRKAPKRIEVVMIGSHFFRLQAVKRAATYVVLNLSSAGCYRYTTNVRVNARRIRVGYRTVGWAVTKDSWRFRKEFRYYLTSPEEALLEGVAKVLAHNKAAIVKALG